MWRFVGFIVVGVILIAGTVCAEPADTEPNDDPSSAQAIALNGSVTGSAYHSSDVDWFSFPGQPGMQVRIDLFHQGSFLGITDFVLELYSPTLSLIAQSDGVPVGNIEDERITQTLTQSGLHYIAVLPYPGLWSPIANSYSLDLDWLNQPTPTPTATVTPTVTWTPYVPETSVAGWEIYR